MSILRKMKMIRLNSQVRKAFQGSSRGLTLIEVAIGIALMGVIAIAILGALSAATTWLITVDERATAESLARSQMEYVKNQSYSLAPWGYNVTDSDRNCTEDGCPSWWDLANDNPPLLSEEYAGYTAKVEAELLYDDGSTLKGIQKITVTVSYDIIRPDHEVVEKQFILEGYKRKPGDVEV